MTIRYLQNPANSADVRGLEDSIPSDVAFINALKAQKFVDITGSWPPAPPPETAKDIDAAVQLHLDAAAVRRGYADAATCVSYMSSTVTAWAADSKAMNQWRDDAWNATIAQEAITPLPSVAAVLAAVDALASNPKW